MTAGVKVWDWPVRITHWVLAVAVLGAWWTGERLEEWFVVHRACGVVVLVAVLFRLGWGLFGTRSASGGWAVLALWLVALAQASTGLFANDDVMNAGPFYGWVADGLSDALTAWHEEIFDFLLVLVGIHVGAVLFYRFWGRQNLLPGIFGGRRNDVPASDDIGAELPWRALLWLAVVVALVGGLLWLAPPAVLDAF